VLTGQIFGYAERHRYWHQVNERACWISGAEAPRGLKSAPPNSFSRSAASPNFSAVTDGSMLRTNPVRTLPGADFDEIAVTPDAASRPDRFRPFALDSEPADTDRRERPRLLRISRACQLLMSGTRRWS